MSAKVWGWNPHCLCRRCDHYSREVWYGCPLDEADDPTKSTADHITTGEQQ